MRKVFFFITLFAISTQIEAAVTDSDTTRKDRLNYKELNFLNNIYSESHNPVALSFNKVQTLADINFNGHFERGAFHAVNKSSKHNDFTLDISGLKQIGKFSLSGNIKYLNSKDYNHKWENSYMITPENPFVLGDSVSSNVNTEEFTLHMGSAYRFNDNFIAGLKIKYTTGSLSDQEDPRPKTNSMHFLVNPGAWYKLSDNHNVGLSADIDIYRSNMSHSIINGLLNQVYFLMKGMGDNQTFTSHDVSGYTRDYKGTRLGINAQWNALFGEFENLLELGFNTNSENAEDGGSSYTFKGGDYKSNKFSLYDRFTFGSDALKHNISISASLNKTESYWYDQERKVDTEHGNLNYFEILSKDKNHEATYADASLEYRIDGLKNDLPDWSARAKFGVSNTDITQYELDANNQKYTIANIIADGTKNWDINKLRLETTLGAFYQTTLGTPTFGTVRNKLYTEYTAPSFEFATAKAAGFNVRLALNIPISLYKTPTWLTVYGKTSCRFYNGDNEYSNRYDGKSQAYVDFGLNLTL